MTKDEIQAEFNGFIEYPQDSDNRYVTTASTLFFAHHIAEMAVKREREACAKVCEEKANEDMGGEGYAVGLSAAEAIRSRAQ